MPHYLLDAANNATELPFADLDSVQSILNTMPTLAPEAPVLACEILDAWAEDCRILRRRPKLVLLNVRSRNSKCGKVVFRSLHYPCCVRVR